jgi:hypothetical protein
MYFFKNICVIGLKYVYLVLQAVSRKERDVQVKPINCVPNSLSNVSTAARRILEALERISTPVLDAKRIPLEPSAPPLSNKRKRQHGTGK